MSRRYLTVKDVAARYGGAWSEWQIRELARTNRLPHRKHAGCSRLLFLETELDAYDDGAPLHVRTLPKGGRIVTPTTTDVRRKRAA